MKKRFIALLCAALLFCTAATASAEGLEGLFGKGLQAAGDAFSSLLDGNPLGEEGEKPKDFKALMDEYEAFFDEYIAFMENFDETSSDVQMMLDYTSMLTRYAQAMEALDEIDEEELTDEDVLYYTEVMLRIQRKLAEASL